MATCDICGGQPAPHSLPSALTLEEVAQNAAWAESLRSEWHTGHPPHLELPRHACSECRSDQVRKVLERLDDIGLTPGHVGTVEDLLKEGAAATRAHWYLTDEELRGRCRRIIQRLRDEIRDPGLARDVQGWFDIVLAV